MGDAADTETISMVAARGKWLVSIALASYVLVRSAVAVSDGRAVGWVFVVFFGLYFLVGVRAWLSPTMLVIDARGITSRTLLGTSRFEFDDCSEFRVWDPPMGRKRGVVFDGTTSTRSERQRVERSYVPDTFGMPAEDLVALLNGRRAASAGGR